MKKFIVSIVVVILIACAGVVLTILVDSTSEVIQ